MIVVDANVLFNATTDRLQSPVADRVRQRDPAWFAPILWGSEFRNIVATQIRAKRMTLKQGLGSYLAAKELIAGRSEPVNGRQVLEISAASGASAYDCEYVWLARELRVPLVTFDRKLRDLFPEVAVLPEEFTAESE